jgi:dihydroorotate dehydrogenase (NAD+) catalytic subunit
LTGAAKVLRVNAASIEFQNPLLLAAGTAAYGRELQGVIDIDSLGGIVTKAVSPEPRAGAPAPRVAEFEGGMINAVGLANPGLDAVRSEDIPWLEKNVRDARVIVNVIGKVLEDFATVVEGLTSMKRVDAFELNVSCPNTKAGGMEFGADPSTLSALIRRARTATSKPLFVKLSPTLPSIADTARLAVDSGADGLTLVNTIPGLVIDVESRKPALGFGSGGVSGPGILPVGVLAVWKASRAVKVPLIGVGGITKGTDAIQYMMAGASLVAIGTAAMRDPRAPRRVISEIESWLKLHRHNSVSGIIGSLDWQS